MRPSSPPLRGVVDAAADTVLHSNRCHQLPPSRSRRRCMTRPPANVVVTASRHHIDGGRPPALSRRPSCTRAEPRHWGAAQIGESFPATKGPGDSDEPVRVGRDCRPYVAELLHRRSRCGYEPRRPVVIDRGTCRRRRYVSFARRNKKNGVPAMRSIERYQRRQTDSN